LKVFSIKDLKLLDDKFEKAKLSSWIKKWYLKSIKKWFYLYWNVEINENLLFFISNKIYSPSYVSLETALNHYWIIPEYTFVITAVTSNKTTNFNAEVWNFSYKKIKPELFWGYNIINFWDYKVLIWELEKVILDYFYLNSRIKNLDDLEGLRWNKEELKKKLDLRKLEKYLKIYASKVLTKKVELLIKYINLW
jgi:predicted transcriptional regulator of viral defense system